MGKRTYKEKLRDPRWQKMRLLILERDGWQCQYCGSKTDCLHVHHGYYKSNSDPWEYDRNCLHAVCDKCHEHADDIRHDIQYEVAQLPLAQQELLIHVVNGLNCMFADDIERILCNTLSDIHGGRVPCHTRVRRPR